MTEAAEFIQDLAVIMIAAALGGLLCKRIGLSPIVGYLAAGIVVGPHTPPYAFVTDIERTQILAQLGMVFLMFGIGLSFSLRRLRQLGLPLLLATAGTAFLVFTLGRISASALGLGRAASIFFAGLLVVSSSAVIGKVLNDAGRSHEKSSQLAFGITLSEDIVAIVLLTLLGSYVQFGADGTSGAARPALLPTLALFGGFVLVLATAGLLVVPRVLRKLSREASAELETIFIAGLIFGLSLMVVRAGYSLALGAFLLGTIISETPQRAHVERAFAGLRDFFGAVFFVAIGMTIDVQTLPHAIGPLAALTAIALVGRVIAATVSLLLLGFDSRTAVQTGLIVTPLGEFSFIIAQLGTTHGILPEAYMSAAVGASLLSTLAATLLIRHNRAIAQRLTRWRVPLLSQALILHRRVLQMLEQQRESSLLWRLTRKRVAQIAIEVALVSAVLFFAHPLVAWLAAALGEEIVPNVSTALICWSALGVVLLVPLIAIWRNLQALALILADYFGRQAPGLTRARPLAASGLQAFALLALSLWLWNVLPVEAGPWMSIGVVAFLALVAAFSWRRMIRWHSNLEISLESALGDDVGRHSYEWMDPYTPWGLQIGEVVVPDRFAFAGRSIGEIGIRARFGCSAIGIERQSFTIANPGPGSHLFPGDRVLLLGTEQQIAAARGYLLADRPGETSEDTFRDLALELVEIPAGSPASRRRLHELNWPRLLGVQVVGHERGAEKVLTPAGDLLIEAGDRVLVLGTPQQVKMLREWLLPPPAEASTAGAVVVGE